MKSLTDLLKKLRLRQAINIFVVGLLLTVGITCGDQYAQAANPENPSMEASLQINTQLLIAANNPSELLYPGAETPQGQLEKERELPIITEKSAEQPKEGGLIQREPNLSTRVKGRLETVKEAVEEASEFISK